jgi:predicted amidohydrolase YtcJ
MNQLIIKNADIHTQDMSLPRARAVAVSKGKIIAVGSDDEVLYLAGCGTQILDAGGRPLLPGFIDSHVHYLDWAISLQNLPAGEAKSCESLLAMISEKAASLEPGQWISGRGLDESIWSIPKMPGLDELDRAAPRNPLFIYRRDMHMALANSLALKAAGIGPGTPDPPEGKIGRDKSGNPNGALRERALNLISDQMPEPDLAERVRIMHQAQARLHSLGVTGVHDLRIMGGICGQPSFTAWQELEATRQLKLRIWMCLGGDHLDEIIRLGLISGYGGKRLKTGHVKFFSDGTLGSRTAWTFEPYLDAECGMQMTPADELAEKIALAQANGLACSVHAIGDRANHAVLGAFARAAQMVRANNPHRPLAPHRIEHVQMLREQDLPRLAGSGITASVQPQQTVEDFAVAKQGLADGGVNSYRFRDFLDNEIPVCFGSDAPVCEPDPLKTLHAAITRQNDKGEPAGGWHPAQRLSLSEAVYAHTMGPALACGRQHELGSITPGKFADLVLLDRDIYTLSPKELQKAGIAMTVFNGQVVHRI